MITNIFDWFIALYGKGKCFDSNHQKLFFRELELSLPKIDSRITVHNFLMNNHEFRQYLDVIDNL